MPRPIEYGAGVSDVRQWIADARGVRLEEAGEQAALFGPPVKMYKLIARSGESLLVTADQVRAYNLRGIAERAAQGSLF
jgi:hypothetical protein